MNKNPILIKNLHLFILAYLSLASGCYAMNNESRDLTELLSGNTLSVVNKYGPTLIYFNENKNFKQVSINGRESNGYWRTIESSLCLTVKDTPYNIKPKEYCMTVKNKTFGSTWTSEDKRNGEIKYTIYKGHVKFK